MAAPFTYRQPVPLFVPTLTVTLVLLVLYGFGLREQERLTNNQIEQAVQQRETIAHIVAEGIESDLQRTETSARRFAEVLASKLILPFADIENRFATEIETLPDGSHRNRHDGFDPLTQAGVWIPNYVQLDAGARQFFARAQALTELYGRGAQGEVFMDTWILPAMSGLIMFWPSEPDFIFQVAAAHDYRQTEWIQVAHPDINPQRQTRWTHLLFDSDSEEWMMSAVAPLYLNDKWEGTVGHDLSLHNLLERTALLRQQQGSHFVLLSTDDVVLASDHHADAIKQSNGTLSLAQLNDTSLQQAVKQARQTQGNPHHQRFDFDDDVLFVSRIQPHNWLLVNSVPLRPIASAIHRSFLNLRNIAATALVLELVIATLILLWSHRRSRKQFETLAAIQRRLQASETHYRNLVDNIPGVVYRCRNDEQWTMEFISPSIQELTGYPASDFVGNSVRSFVSIIHPDDRPYGSRVVEDSLQDQRPFALEYRICRADRSIRWVLEQGRWASTPEGEESQLEGVILDISPLKQAEEKLRELNGTLEIQVEQRTAALKEAIADLETFNNAMSHDLRAPVRQVSGYLDALQDELQGKMTADIQYIIERSQLALGRMREMIASLHAFSQLGRDALAPVRVNVNDMVCSLIDSLPENVRQRAHFDVAELHDVSADRTLLRIVLQNLIDNAVKYSSRNAKPVINIRNLESNTEWVLEIRDNGAGFNPQYADRLFQLFQRLHSVDVFPGFGVGLALCKKIVMLHGGRIWAESTINQGARFFVALPLQPVTRHNSELTVA